MEAMELELWSAKHRIYGHLLSDGELDSFLLDDWLFSVEVDGIILESMAVKGNETNTT
jgi:hypothetical protein